MIFARQRRSRNLQSLCLQAIGEGSGLCMERWRLIRTNEKIDNDVWVVKMVNGRKARDFFIRYADFGLQKGRLQRPKIVQSTQQHRCPHPGRRFRCVEQEG